MNITYNNMEESFMEITGCDNIDEASNWLKMTNNNLDESVGLFFTTKDDSIDSKGIKSVDSTESISSNKRLNENEEEIRKPDATKREKLIESEFDIFNFSKEIDMPQNINPTPTHLKYKGDFEKAKKSAKKHCKLLMVNIQLKNNLDSMDINRDLWQDEIITEVIKEKYIFLQLYSDNPKSESIISNYNVFNLPCVLIIEPITGTLHWKNENVINKNDFSLLITGLKPKDNKIKVEDLSELSINSLCESYDEKEIKENIKINLSVENKKIQFQTCNKYDLLHFTKQVSKILKVNFPDKDKFEAYFDFPQKKLLDEIKVKNSKVGKYNFSSVRIFIKFIEN